jgi:hypothetical protein
MAFGVTCTFDLKNASRTDYENAYADLTRIGLKKTVLASSGSHVVAPTTMTIGEFNGGSAEAVRDDVRAKVQAAFTARRFTSEIFVFVGGQSWTWAGATT